MHSQTAFSPVGVPPATKLELTPIAWPDGAWLRRGLSPRKESPFVAVRFVVCGDGHYAGLQPELLLWPKPYRGFFHRRAAGMVGEAVPDDPDAVIALLERTLPAASYRAAVGTDSWGYLAVDPLYRRIERVEPPAPIDPSVHPVGPPPAARHPGVPALDVERVTDQAALERVVDRALRSPRVALDIETAAAPGQPPEAALDPKAGRIRLIQLGIDHPELGPQQAVIDLFAVDPAPLLPLLTAPGVVKLVHYARFEAGWIRRHLGVSIDPVVDTQVAWSIAQRHLQQLEPEREPHDNTLATLAERILGERIGKEEQASDWSAPELSAEQIAYAARDVAVLGPIADETARMVDWLGCASQVEQAGRAGRAEAERAALA